MFKEKNIADKDSLHRSLELTIKEKQINALYHLSEGFEQISNEKHFLRFFTEALPPAFLRPEDTSVHLSFRNEDYISNNFFNTNFKISSRVSTNTNEELIISVFFKTKELLQQSDTGSNASRFLDLMTKRVAKYLNRLELINTLNRKSEILTTLLESLPNPTFYKDSSGRYKWCNSAFEKLFNLKKEDIIEKTSFDILTPQIAKKIHNADIKVIKTLQNLSFEAKIPLKDSSPKDVLIYKIPLSLYEDDDTGILGLIVDLTEIKKEERIEKIQHSFNQAVAMGRGMQETIDTILKSILELDFADCAGIYLASNNKELLLHSSIGLSQKFVDHTRIFRKETPYTKLIFEKKSVFGTYESDFTDVMDDIRREEGIKSIGIVPLIYNNRVIGCVNIASKKYKIITESDKKVIKELAPRIANMILFMKNQDELKFIRKKLEEKIKEKTNKLRTSSKKIQEINKNLEQKISKAVSERTKQQSLMMQKSKLESLGELAAGIAHEINQPLGIMALSLENLQVKFNRGSATKEYRNEKFNSIFDNIDRIRKIIDHIRTFSRDSGTLNVDKFNVNDALMNCLQLINTQYENHNIKINLLLDNNIGISMGNINSFEQVILNLLSNAKHSVDEKEAKLFDPYYSKSINIYSYNYENKVVLEIIDNGTGIPQKNIDKIFDPFFTTKPAGVGTGLGLSIVFGIIKDMEGEIFVESEENEYTKFTIKLPKY